MKRTTKTKLENALAKGYAESHRALLMVVTAAVAAGAQDDSEEAYIKELIEFDVRHGYLLDALRKLTALIKRQTALASLTEEAAQCLGIDRDAVMWPRDKDDFPHIELEATAWTPLMSVVVAARLIYDNLSDEYIDYARDPARGKYRGFSALHDKCDANMLLPGAEDFDANNQEQTDWLNAVMEQVTKLILKN